MPRWMWFAPLGALVMAAALVGLRFGWHAATLTETDVINAYAAAHMELHGGSIEDCFAESGEDAGAWIVVRCEVAETGEVHSYFVNRLGWLTHADAPSSSEAEQNEGPRT